MVTLRGVGLPEEVVIVPVLHEAPELLVNPRLLGVGHGEVLVLAHDPVPEAAVLHHLVLGPLHALAVLQRHVELLVGDEELGADVLAAVDLLLGVSADTSGGVPVLQHWLLNML